MNDKDWWRGAVIYQIYPRSYMDSNNDGVGDLNGITQKLDYIADLGVDAIWISPFFKSPMKDYGYDVEDYRSVDPIFGTNKDFDTLLQKAHKLNIKIIIDLVLSHTSDQHDWFIESRSNQENNKSDWYVWADPKPDGSPPNNWMSCFGQPAWTFDSRRGQYYLHNFLKEQPDLNFHNPDVQDAMLDHMKYWLDKGVDGFRLDVANFYFHDQALRDNPPRDKNDGLGYISGNEGTSPTNMQRQLYNKTQPENLEFHKKVRKLTDQYENIMTVAEVGDEDAFRVAAAYSLGENHLNTSYNTQLMGGMNKDLTISLIREPIERYQSFKERGWPSWAFSNHDVVRVASRWGQRKGYDKEPNFAKLLLSTLLSLQGTLFIYQGEELGLPEANIAFEQLHDPWGISMWPDWKGRDGCRTPMVWDDMKPNAGFSNAETTWLPVDARHPALAVKAQEQDADSTLNFTRAFLDWRKKQPALVKGDIEFIDSGSDMVLCFKRTDESQTIFCAFNFADVENAVSDPAGSNTQEGSLFMPEGEFSGQNDKGSIKLPPFGCYFKAL
jgi:alpha-glucosidase